MLDQVKNTDLFADYYAQWVHVYKEGAIRKVTLDKYLMTQTWLYKLIPELKMCDMTRIAYQQLLNDYAESHERQTTMDFHHQLKGAILDAVDEGLIDRDPTRKVIIKGKTPAEKKIKYLNQFDVIRIVMTDKCCIWHTAAMVRKSVITDNNIEYEQFYSPAEDYQLWARLMKVTHFYNIQEVLVKYRTFGNQTSAVQSANMNAAHVAVQLGIINEFPAYRDAWRNSDLCTTRFRISLFGIPILKIKHNRILLFEFIPVGKIKWR